MQNKLPKLSFLIMPVVMEIFRHVIRTVTRMVPMN